MGKEPTKSQQEAGMEFLSHLGAIIVVMNRVEGWERQATSCIPLMANIGRFLSGLSEEGHEVWHQEAKAALAVAQGMEEAVDRYRARSRDARNN